MAALIDTGFLLAVLDADDELHEKCTNALQEEPEPLLPDVVIPELAYMILRELGYSTLIIFLRSLADGELEIIHTSSQDLSHSADWLENYQDNRVDFVDCALVAMAESLNITKILTVDRRHFGAFRPAHCNTFEIVP